MENILNGLVLLGIPAVVLLPLLILGFKQLGMPTSWTGPVAILVGILLVAAIEAIKEWPSVERYVAVVVFGMLLGLGANGLNSQWKHFVKTREDDAREKAQAQQTETKGTPIPRGDDPTVRIQLGRTSAALPIAPAQAGEEYQSRDVVTDELPRENGPSPTVGFDFDNMTRTEEPVVEEVKPPKPKRNTRRTTT
jgi:hypothetical protein